MGSSTHSFRPTSTSRRPPCMGRKCPGIFRGLRPAAFSAGFLGSTPEARLNKERTKMNSRQEAKLYRQYQRDQFKKWLATNGEPAPVETKAPKVVTRRPAPKLSPNQIRIINQR